MRFHEKSDLSYPQTVDNWDFWDLALSSTKYFWLGRFLSDKAFWQECLGVGGKNISLRCSFIRKSFFFCPKQVGQGSANDNNSHYVRTSHTYLDLIPREVKTIWWCGRCPSIPEPHPFPAVFVTNEYYDKLQWMSGNVLFFYKIISF